MPQTTFKTCESVCEGHPDKVCDQVSDAVVDACLSQDPSSRIGCECLIKDNNLIIAGEITSKAKVDYAAIGKKTLKEIGYGDEELDKFQIEVLVSQQSPDIALGVDTGGAGDQGMMYGYACSETPQLLPLALALSHSLCQRLAEKRKADPQSPLRPDGKAQVTVRYEDGVPVAVDAVVVSTQHNAEISATDLENYVYKEIIQPVLGKWLQVGPLINPHLGNRSSGSTKIYINPTGRFEVGGSYGDCGLTGRKLAVDTYGGIGRIGGGALSGKDPSKVDRSAAYMARYLAKKLIALGYGREVEVRLAYAIGVAQPVDVNVNIIDGDRSRASEAEAYLQKNFDLSPAGIIKFLDLRRPIYRPLASYGHFGREGFAWEETK